MAGPFKMKGWSPFHQEEEKVLARAIKPPKVEGKAIGPRFTFKKAFRAARDAGDETFRWTDPKTGKTKTYTTETK